MKDLTNIFAQDCVMVNVLTSQIKQSRPASLNLHLWCDLNPLFNKIRKKESIRIKVMLVTS